MTVYFLYQVKGNTHRNQQARAAIETGNHKADTKRTRDHRGNDGDQCKKPCTNVRNSHHHLLQIVRRPLPGTIARNECSHVLQIVRHVLGIEHDGSPEVTEEVNQYDVQQVVNQRHRAAENVSQTRHHGQVKPLPNRGKNDLGEHQQAIQIFKQVTEIAIIEKDKRAHAISLGNLGLVDHSLREDKRAVTFYKQDLEIAREIGDQYLEAISLENLGSDYLGLGKHELAISFHHQSLEMSQEIHSRRIEARALSNLERVIN